ncbi:hypothetical protein ABZY03_27130, partial [Streptomyces klenkii]|uniref:hypothetical protein n=1 Tax=Streptomyces klenkii TaxID=1420899 RepID=UPI0033AB82B3
MTAASTPGPRGTTGAGPEDAAAAARLTAVARELAEAAGAVRAAGRARRMTFSPSAMKSPSAG